MIEIWRVLRTPQISVALVLAGSIPIGLWALSQGWRGAAATLFVPYQIPYLVSGGLFGLAVVGSGLTLLRVHLDRADSAQERHATAALQRDVLRMLSHVLRQRP